MKNLLPLMVLLLLSGCMRPWAKIPSRHATPLASTAPVAPVATLEVHRANPIELFSGYEARCAILSIDGAPIDSNYQLLPGNHTLTVSLLHLGQEYVGDVDLVIPEAKSYELKAKRKGDAFTLSIVDVETDKIIATSTAPLTERLKFLVFVVQK